MKVTWKYSKKRSLPAVSNFSNLPFEHQKEDVTPHQDPARFQGNEKADIVARNSDQSKPNIVPILIGSKTSGQGISSSGRQAR